MTRKRSREVIRVGLNYLLFDVVTGDFLGGTAAAEVRQRRRDGQQILAYERIDVDVR